MNETQLRGASVVVVDDDADVVELFRVSLELCGAVAVAFTSTPDAEAWLRDHRADVVVSDLDVPGDGIESLLATAKARGVASLVVTGHAQQSRLDAALAAGFDDYRVKPVDPMGLCRAVEKLLERMRLMPRIDLGSGSRRVQPGA